MLLQLIEYFITNSAFKLVSMLRKLRRFLTNNEQNSTTLIREDRILPLNFPYYLRCSKSTFCAEMKPEWSCIHKQVHTDEECVFIDGVELANLENYIDFLKNTVIKMLNNHLIMGLENRLGAYDISSYMYYSNGKHFKIHVFKLDYVAFKTAASIFQHILQLYISFISYHNYKVHVLFPIVFINENLTISLEHFIEHRVRCDDVKDEYVVIKEEDYITYDFE